MNCKNHPERDAVKECVSCGEVFCEDCLSDYQGKLYCAPCRKAEVALGTTRLTGGTSDLARMKKSLIGCSVILLAVILLPMALMIFPLFSLGDVGKCRANLKQIYKALVEYTEEYDGGFPPGNNDLSPLFVKHLSGSDMKLLQCPGRGSRTSRTGGSGTSLTSEQPPVRLRSYLYQGNLSLPMEGDSPKSLMWDRDSFNHRGKGINVLYTDGTVKFETKRLSRFHLRKTDGDP